MSGAPAVAKLRREKVPLWAGSRWRSQAVPEVFDFQVTTQCADPAPLSSALRGMHSFAAGHRAPCNADRGLDQASILTSRHAGVTDGAARACRPIRDARDTRTDPRCATGRLHTASWFDIAAGRTRTRIPALRARAATWRSARLRQWMGVYCLRRRSRRALRQRHEYGQKRIRTSVGNQSCEKKTEEKKRYRFHVNNGI